MQKKEQKQAAAQKQEMLQKQMANTMNKYFKPIEKSTQVRTKLLLVLLIKFFNSFRKTDKQQQRIITVSIIVAQMILIKSFANR